MWTKRDQALTYSDGLTLIRDSFDTMVFPGEQKALSTLDFITKYTADPRPNLDWKPFSIQGHEWQGDLLNDLVPKQVCIKCSQIGVSEMNIRKALALVAHHGLNVAYVMPTLALLNLYGPTRVKTVISRSKRLSNSLSGGFRETSTHYMFANTASLYMLHASSETMSIAVSLDAVFLDEFDRITDDSADMWPQRLGHSAHKILFKYSTPIAPQTGVHAAYLESDQKEYLFKCPACNHYQNLTFPGSIRFHKGLVGLPEISVEMPQRTGIDSKDWLRKYQEREPYVGCVRCGKEMDREDQSLKEWVAKIPSRSKDATGYALNRFHVPKTKDGAGHDAATILDDFFSVKRLKEFYNQVLGQPYSSSSDSIGVEDMELAVLPSGNGYEVYAQPPYGTNFLGIDIGKNIHLIVLNMQGQYCSVVHMECINMAADILSEIGFAGVLDKIEGVVRRFNVDFTVCDGGPDITFPRALVTRMPFSAAYAFFKANEKDHSVPNPSKESWDVKVNRNWIIGSLVGIVKRTHEKHTLRLASNFREFPEFKELTQHFTSMVRVEVEDQTKGSGRVRVEWRIKSSQENHYLFAACYALLAYNIRYRQDSLEPVSICMPNEMFVSKGHNLEI